MWETRREAVHRVREAVIKAIEEVVKENPRLARCYRVQGSKMKK